MGEGGGRSSGGAWKLRNAASKVAVAAVYACGSFSRTKPLPIDTSPSPSLTISNSSYASPSTTKTSSRGLIEEIDCNIVTENNGDEIPSKNLCAICLDPLSYNSKGSNPGQAIFTAQCSHAFHFACISSNVHHGSVTCPICRAHWTQLPRNLKNNLCGSTTPVNQSDPILQILDDSIATFRFHRRTLLRSTRYDNDDTVEPDNAPDIPKLRFSLVPIPPNAQTSFHPAWQMTKHASCRCHLSLHCLSCGSSSMLQSPPMQSPYIMCPSNRPYLSLRLAHERATDFVLVASPNGPHLRLLKQSMALLVDSLRHVDRLAIVTCPSAAARVFPLRRMTSYGKHTALQVIDRLFYMGQADPIEGLKKGIKILEDRMHKNPKSCILHLSDNPTRPCHAVSMELPSTPIHRFHVGFGFGFSNRLVIQEFEGFLAKMLGGIVREIQLRICGTGEGVGSGRVIRIGEIRGGEEGRVLLDLGDSTHIYVEYSYIEGEIDECVRRTGETVVGIGDHKGSLTEAAEETGRDMNTGGRSRTSNVESWDFHDPYTARRWAKHLQGYRP